MACNDNDFRGFCCDACPSTTPEATTQLPTTATVTTVPPATTTQTTERTTIPTTTTEAGPKGEIIRWE